MEKLIEAFNKYFEAVQAYDKASNDSNRGYSWDWDGHYYDNKNKAEKRLFEVFEEIIEEKVNKILEAKNK